MTALTGTRPFRTPVPLDLLIGVTVLAPPASGRTADGVERLAGVRYLEGKADFPKKVDGTLIAGPDEVRFERKGGALVFRLATADVVDARHSTVWHTFPATPGTADLLELEMRAGGGTETLLFRTPLHQAAGLAAKIRFWRDH